MRLAILFSGQGNQQPAHLEALRQAPPIAKSLAEPLTDALADSPTESLTESLAQALAARIPDVWQMPDVPLALLQTNRIAQPLIFASQLALWQQLAQRLPRPVAVAGYSLGEMAACCVAGCFSAEEGIALCAERAAAMDACIDTPAGLLAIAGLPAACSEALAADCGLAVAIRNGPDHLVLGGPEPGLQRAARQAEQLGAARVVRLGVTTPSHTPWLAAAAERFARRLASLHPGLHAQPQPQAQRLTTPVFSAIDGRPAWQGPAALQALARQIDHPLDWTACQDAIAERQPDAILEIGPGNALARMWAERHPHIPIRASDEFRSVEGIVEWVEKQGRG
ncbi:malonate decarboxylase subunit epsilon [Zoogloea dura]|uniref:Malonate decarboxylase subunit epsilon n=1 Tax=Zoogloea dura TaxID=2728840 RepID=A0A848GCH4_9RHOO|nr:malonate decarboxylase subunit epsilon [Zoogloea dura]NML29080.1 malonate decarboxylase subunit epsilon [Zoogloea dura]